MNKEVFVEELKKINIDINEEQLNKLETYYNFLIEYNKNVNLTRIVDKSEVYLKHFYDSLTLVKAIDLNNINSLCDVGTGAGFPGMVLAIVYPTISVTLVDALQKRINFLDELVEFSLERNLPLDTSKYKFIFVETFLTISSIDNVL